MGVKSATGGVSSADSTAVSDPPVFKKNPEEFAVVVASVLRAAGPATIKADMIGRWLGLHPDPKEQARFLQALTPLLAKAPLESLPEVAAKLRESATAGPAQNAPALSTVADVLAPPPAAPSLPADRVTSDAAPKATATTKKPTLAPPSKDPVLAGATGRIADLCAGYTSSGDEKKILATVREYIGETAKPPLPPAERMQRAQALITELEKRGITYGRVVDELESPADKKAFLDATLPAATPDQKADAIAQASHSWLWRLLELFFGFADDRDTVAQITASAVSTKDGGVGKQSADNYRELFAACDRAGVDFETLYDNLPKAPPQIREHFVAVATQSMTLDQRAHAIALLVHGATPADKERAIGHLLKDNVLPEERQTLLAAIKKYDVEFSDLKSELGADDRAFLVSAYSDPQTMGAFTTAGLPVMVADFEAARAKTVTAPTERVADLVAGAGQLLPADALAKDALSLRSEDPAKRETAVKHIAVTLTAVTTELAVRVAAGEAEVTRLSAVTGEHDKKIVAAQALVVQLEKSAPGSPAALDAARTLAFLQEERAKIADTRDALNTQVTTLKERTELLRTMGASVSGMTTETAALTADYLVLAREQAAASGALAANTDPARHLALLHRCEDLGHKLAAFRAELSANPARAAQAKASGLDAVVEADLKVVQSQVGQLVTDVMQLHFVDRTQSELVAQKASIDGSTFIAAGAEKLAAGTDAQIDAFVSGYPARIAAVQTEIKRLQGEKRAAEAVVAKFKSSPPETTDDRLALAKAQMTLAGATPGAGKGSITLAETIGALKQTAMVLAQSRAMLTERRTMLRDGLNQQLDAAGLPRITGTTNEALWAAMTALSKRLGLPVPPLPGAGTTFAVAADPVGKYLAEANAAQLGTGLMVISMLKTRGVTVPGATWVSGKLELPHLALAPGQKPPAAVDLVATHKLIETGLTLLARDVGVETIDDASMMALVKVANGEKIEGTQPPLFVAIQAQAQARTVLEGGGFRALAGVKGYLSLTELTAIAHGNFAAGMNIPSDPKERARIRAAAYLVITNVEVRDAMLSVSGSKDGFSSDVIDAFGIRLYDYAPKDKDHPEIESGRIPASSFVYHVDMARTLPQAVQQLHEALHPTASASKWEAALQNLPLATRQMMVAEYERAYGKRDAPGAIFRELAEAFSGTDLGRSLAMLDGPSASEIAHDTMFHAGRMLEGKLDEIEAWQTTFDVDYNTGFWSFLYDMSGTRPSEEERTLLGKDVAQVKKDLAAFKEAARTGDPEVENLRAQLAHSLGVAAADLHIIRSGSSEATDNAIRKLGVAGTIAKAVTITAVATAVTLGTLGAAAPAAEGVAGASWVAVGVSVAAGTAAGTATGALLSASTQYIETGGVDAKKLGDDTRDAAITSFTTALTAGVSTAAMAKMVAAAANGGRMATIMGSPVWRAVVMSGMNTGLTVVGEGMGAVVRAHTGDKAGADKIWEELPMTALRSFVDSMLLAGIGGKFHGPTGRLIDGVTQGALQLAWNKAQHKELTEGLVQTVINGMVMGQVFETSHAMMELRAAGASKVRAPNEPAGTKATWKITGFDETVNRVTLERIGKGGAPERMEIDGTVLAEANPQLKGPKEVAQPKLTKEIAAEQVKAALSSEGTIELAGRQWKAVVSEATGLVRLEAVGRPDLVHEVPATVLVDRLTQPIPPGLESGVVPGMGNGLASKGAAFAAVDHAMRSGGKVSMASLELHQFKEWGNVEGNHDVGNAYITATANELQSYLRANGFADAQVFHQGGKGFRIVYAGGDEVHFAQVMEGLTKAPASAKFKAAIDAGVRKSVSAAEAAQLKPASDINLYVGLATAPEGGVVRDPTSSREATETLFEHSYASGKYAQLSGQGFFAKPGEAPVSAESAVAAGKKAKRDTFASYDAVATGPEYSRMLAEPAFVNEMAGYGMSISDANIAMAGTADPSTLSLTTKEQLFLSGDIGKTKGGRLIIYGRNMADYYARTLTAAVAAGTARPCELLISETGGDEVRVLKVEIGADGKPVLHSYAIDINDFGAASSLSGKTKDGAIIAGTKVADGIKAQVFDQLDTALSDPSARPFADKLADANVRLYGSLTDPKYAIMGKVEAHEVQGFAGGKKWSVGETGTVRVGDVSYKATVVAAGKMRLEAPGGKVVELGFDASGTDPGPQKLTLKVPNVRTTLSMGGMSIPKEALEVVTIDGRPVTRFTKAFLDKLGAGARYAAAAEPNLEAFMAKVTDAYANFLKKNGKAPAVAGGGQVEPRAFVSDMLSDPKFAGQLKELFAAEYADRPHTRDLPPELQKLADAFLAGTTAKTAYDSASGLATKSQKEAAPALGVSVLEAKAVQGSTLVETRVVAGDGRALAQEVATARMLEAQGFGPHVLGISDLGGGAFAVVTEKLPASALSTADLPALRAIAERLRASGFDLKGATFAKDAEGKLLVTSGVARMEGKPASLADAAVSLAMAGAGLPLLKEVSPAQAQAALGKEIKGLPADQAAGVTRAFNQAQGIVSVARDAKGTITVIDSVELPDGARAIRTTTIDKLGNLPLNGAMEVVDATGTAIKLPAGPTPEFPAQLASSYPRTAQAINALPEPQRSSVFGLCERQYWARQFAAEPGGAAMLARLGEHASAELCRHAGIELFVSDPAGFAQMARENPAGLTSLIDLGFSFPVAMVRELGFARSVELAAFMRGGHPSLQAFDQLRKELRAQAGREIGAPPTDPAAISAHQIKINERANQLLAQAYAADPSGFGPMLAARQAKIFHSGDGVVLLRGEPRVPHRATTVAELSPLAKKLGISSEHLARVMADPGAYPADTRKLMDAITAGLPEAERAALGKELNGRQFVDKKHFDAAYEAGVATPELRYGEGAWKGWKAASDYLATKAANGEPLTLATLLEAHRLAGEPLGAKAKAGTLRTESVQQGGGGIGVQEVSAEAFAAMKGNADLQVLDLGEGATPGSKNVMVTYLKTADVPARVNVILERVNQRLAAGEDPMKVAADTQRELVSVHPFMDGNGRISRLIMDYVLERAHMPPSVISDTNLDTAVDAASWQKEVAKGVGNTWDVYMTYWAKTHPGK